MGGKREINPSAPEWQILAGIPRDISQGHWCLRLSFQENFDDETQSSVVQARLTARGDQDPDLLALVRNNQTSAPTESLAGK